MKKLFFISILTALMCTLTAFTSDDLIGRWSSSNIDLPSSSPGEVVKMKCEYQFVDARSVKVMYNMSYDITLERKVHVDAFYEITAEGQWAAAGDSIIVLIDVNTLDLKMSEDNVRVTGVGMHDGIDQREIRHQIYTTLLESAEGPLKAETERMDVLNNIVINGKKMTCLVNDIPMTFKRKK